MLRMMMWRRRRKMMMLRIMMWRRRTDPKTATHTVCEPARSKSTWRFHKSHLIRKFTSKMPRTSCGPKPRHTHTYFVRACAIDTHLAIAQESQEHIYRENGENAAPQNRDTHFARACAIKIHLEISQEPLYTKILLFSCVSVDLSELINCPMRFRIIPERKQKSPFLVSSPWQPEQSMYLNKARLSIIISIN